MILFHQTTGHDQMFQPSYVTYLSILSLHEIYAARAIRPQRLWFVRNRVNNAISNDRSKSSSYRDVMGCILLLIKTSGFELCMGYFSWVIVSQFCCNWILHIARRVAFIVSMRRLSFLFFLLRQNRTIRVTGRILCFSLFENFIATLRVNNWWT